MIELLNLKQIGSLLNIDDRKFDRGWFSNGKSRRMSVSPHDCYACNSFVAGSLAGKSHAALLFCRVNFPVVSFATDFLGLGVLVKLDDLVNKLKIININKNSAANQSCSETACGEIS